MGEESMFPCAFRVWGSWGGGMGAIGVAMYFECKGERGEMAETRDHPEILILGIE